MRALLLIFLISCVEQKEGEPPPVPPPPPPSAPKDPPGRIVAGTATFADAAPPESFSVSLSDRTLTFKTVPGTYRLTGLTEPLATLRFEAAGFASANVYTAIPETGEARADVTLYPECKVRGTVRDSKGEPIPGALVAVASAEKTLYWFQRPSVTSGADGSFELGDIPPGKTYLSVGATGLARSFAGPLEASPSTPARADVVLLPAVRIGGRVHRGKQPVTDATVELRADRVDSHALGLVYTPAETDEQGRFTIGDSSAGARRLVVIVVQGEEKEHGVQRGVQVQIPAKGTNALDVDLETGDATLTVNFPSGERGELLVLQGKIVADRALDLEAMLGTVHYAQVGADDKTITFEHVASGGHTLILMPPPDLRLLPGGCHCIQQQMEITRGAKTAKIELSGQR